METTFFKELNKYLKENIDLTITVRRTQEQLSVSVLPKSNTVKDEAKSLIHPLILTGSDHEIDEEFFNVISSPLQKSTSLLKNLNDYERSIEIAESESKAAKAKQEEEKKKKEKVEKLLVKVDEFISNKDFEKALSELNEELLIFPDSEKLKSKIDEVKTLKAKSAQVSLF